MKLIVHDCFFAPPLDEGSTLLPILVDESRDLICYLRVGGDKKISGFKFSVRNLGAVKVHPSVYTTVEASDPSAMLNNLASSLQVMFRAEVFDSKIKPGADYENDTAGFSHIEDILSDLATYSVKPFKDFYWSSADAEEFYNTHHGPPAFQFDVKRAQHWVDLRNRFATLSEESDVCKFKQMKKSAIFLPVSILVRILLPESSTNGGSIYDLIFPLVMTGGSFGVAERHGGN